MHKHTIFIVPILLSLLIGCKSDKNNILIKTASFQHPDEIVKGDGFVILADRRIFAVMAFLNAMGYKDEVEGKKMHPVRVKVREMLNNQAKLHPVKYNTWKNYYNKHKLPVYSYLNYVLSLNADYPFKRIRPSSELWSPETANILSDFPDILNDFWSIINLEHIWNKVKSDYRAEIHKYDFERMNHELNFVWEYLRTDRKDSFVIINIPNLLDRHHHAIMSRYENYYYCVESPESHSYGLNIHEYLHSIVNPIVETTYPKYKNKLLAYYKTSREAPLVRSYQNPVTFTYECLVRALDHRIRLLMNNNDLDSTNKRIDHLSQKGLTLTKPFFSLLNEFEDSDMNFESFVPIMLDKLPDYSN